MFRVAEKQKDSSKAMEQIKTAHSFKAFNSDNQLIKSIDTLVSKASRKNMTWDFGDGSKIVLGAIRVEYVVEDYKGNKEQLVYHVCSYNCSVEKPDIDFSKCRYEDQIDPARGFVVATNQVPCN